MWELHIMYHGIHTTVPSACVSNRVNGHHIYAATDERDELTQLLTMLVGPCFLTE